ncbi:MAG: cadmium-translocating P-type ATPase [Myxococcales bacterium]|nr:cadmium-translocating P-type ATPase [Myxococcales bacterium]
MTTTRFRVPQMDCATEKEVIARRLEHVSVVVATEFDLLERVVTVHHDGGDAGADAVERALRDIEMAPVRVTPTVASRAAPAGDHRREYVVVGLAVTLAAAAEIVALAGAGEGHPIVIVLAALALLAGAPRTLRKAWVAARTLTLNINLLMAIAVVGALAIQQWPEAAMVTALFAVAEVVEARSVDRARDAIRGLLLLAPDRTRVRRPTGWVDVATTDVRVGDVVQVRPGERVPIDGVVAAGVSAIDQAPVTGESIPVDKRPGDKVFAGTVNQQGALEVEVTAAAGATTLDHVARAVRDAQARRSASERFVDRFARSYTPSVVVLALGFALVPSLVFGQPFQPWLYKALVMLVIACPCALVVSTPVTIVSGLAAAARLGILVKGGAHLETAGTLGVLALDKTGTLTEGRPRLTDVRPMPGVARDDLLRWAASLEATSAHPIATAVTQGFTGALAPTTQVTAIDGKGLTGVVDGRPLTIGSHRLVEEHGVCRPEVEAILAELEADGKSVMVAWRGDEVLGVLAVADGVRATSVAAVAELRALGVELVMLTGDNPTTAAAVARDVGIATVRADLLPADKLAAIEALAARGPVGMVGDGVNDAPALARASLGFAMGAAGSDTALETADVALMSDDLRGIPTLMRLSRRTRRTLIANISLAIGIKVVFFGLALAGLATLWMAVFADMGASLIVAMNGLRLLRWRPAAVDRSVPPPGSDPAQ